MIQSECTFSWYSLPYHEDPDWLPRQTREGPQSRTWHQVLSPSSAQRESFSYYFTE